MVLATFGGALPGAVGCGVARGAGGGLGRLLAVPEAVSVPVLLAMSIGFTVAIFLVLSGASLFFSFPSYP